MVLGLRDKVVIVGGGSDGLGLAMADRLLNEGGLVFGRRAEEVGEAASRLAEKHERDWVLGPAADCADASDIDRVAAATVVRFDAAVHVLVKTQPELTKADLGAGVPMSRIVERHEFANLTATLISPRLDYVTGVIAPIPWGLRHRNGCYICVASQCAALTDPDQNGSGVHRCERTLHGRAIRANRAHTLHKSGQA